MKKIGIIHREYEHFTLNKELCKVLEQYGILVVGIVPNGYYREAIDHCDGIILQGGEEYSDIDLEICDYLYQNDIPTLGICLGMQIMAVYLNGTLDHLKDNKHYQKEGYVHWITIDKDSKLYSILNTDYMLVNSRHYDYIKKTDMKVVSYSEDHIIEAVEDPNKTFFIGVQWHPESNLDIYNQRLFESFISVL